MMYGAQVKIDARLYFAVSRLFTTRLRVLVVTDGATSLDDLTGSPLGKALALAAHDRPAHRFEVTTAHRASARADLGHFRFDRHDLGQFDQIWIWRTAAAEGEPLTHAELSALAAFVESGGGLFAARR